MKDIDLIKMITYVFFVAAVYYCSFIKKSHTSKLTESHNGKESYIIVGKTI